MKSLEIQTNKRLLIVEFDLGQTMGDALEKLNIKKDLDIICRGSDLTEEIAQGMVQESKYMNYAGESGWVDYKVYPDGLIFGAIESFISAIEAQGSYWGENPVKKPDVRNYTFSNGDPASESERWKFDNEKFEDAESRTFHPEKCLIFEIAD